MIKAKLPKTLKFKTTNDLIRIGRDFNGGYLVSRADVDATDCLIGLGINDDWSFEENFKKLNDVEVLAYDGSVGQKLFFTRVIKDIIRPWRLKKFLESVQTLIKYQLFFKQKKVKHIEKYVGWDSVGVVPYNAFTFLSDILNNLENKRTFLKIDIEGSEYRILNTLVEYKDRLSGCIIEFHDCDLHLDKIEQFVRNFGLRLIHIHANNSAPICQKSKLPTFFELTFSKYGTGKTTPKLPNLLDMPNNSQLPEIEISF